MANQKISTYLTEVLALIPNDRLDISKEISPGVFDTQFLKYSTLLTELNGDLTVDNLYTADDDLTGNRTVGLLLNELTFASTGDANLLKLETTNDRIGIGVAAPGAKIHITEATVGEKAAIIEGELNSSSPLVEYINNDAAFINGQETQFDYKQVSSIVSRVSHTLFAANTWGFKFYGYKNFLNSTPMLSMRGDALNGFNTAAPLANLHVQGITGNNPFRVDDGGTGIALMVLGGGNVGIGTSTPSQKLDVAGNVNLASILSEGLFHLTDKILHRTGGASNTFLGQQSGESTSGDSNNSAFGYRALQDVVGGTQNNAFGSLALSNITTGLWNNAFGKNALDSLNGASQNANSAFGQNSITALTSGLNNSSFGGYSLAALTSGDNNTSLGYNSALSVTGGNNNTFLGAASGGATSGSYSNSIALGYKALITGDNQMVVGNIGGKINEIYLGSGVETDNIIGTDLNIYTTSTAAGNVDQSPSMDWIFNGSQGTGTGAGGDIIFKTAKSGTTGSTQNPLAEILRIKETGVLNVVNIPTAATGLVAGDIYSNGGVLTVV